ncbi:AraC family transcriptional regulator [Falsibacillus pallidus]|uniref:AraC family transcriptional regulator n=1 Tax=Falsibacillus pallidus TaxID=493781 RepID=A0A370GAY4_9BACI|nr:AraC family transcriptional regulator [Falsibacillus pallidus]RDI40928.1 AraC family transcriptional regulator [Falsibacillus pallidus]
MKSLISELAWYIDCHTRKDGVHNTAIPELYFRRKSQPSEPVYSNSLPSLYFVVQGSKTVELANERYHVDPGCYLVSSVHLPVIGQIIQASTSHPYLSLQLTFHPDILLDITRTSSPSKKTMTDRGILTNPSTSDLLNAVLRLVKLLETPSDIEVLAPLIIKEIFYRVLQSEKGELLKQYAMIGSYAHCISEAIEWINQNYSEPLAVAELAKTVKMSPRTLHKHFKKVTAMSPLQYQKVIRLQTARRLLLTENLDAANAGFRVGYESPSQFNREYARLFGRPPIRDIHDLRNSSL